MSTSEHRAYSYSIFHLVTDEIRATTVPVGVALWSTTGEFYSIRFPREAERVSALSKSVRVLLELTEEKIRKWTKSERLPYSATDLRVHSDQWWKQVSSLLVHKIRLSDPLPLECREPEHEIELLFDAVVSPGRSNKDASARLNAVLSHALGVYARRLSKGKVSGFGGRDVPVRRLSEREGRLLIVDAVNLAIPNADKEADALVSKLLRISEGRVAANHQIRSVVGYLASPHGLNGEAALVEWIKTKAGAQAYDLLRERDQFFNSVENELVN